MNIQDLKEKSKLFFGNLKSRLPEGDNATRYYMATVIVLVGLGSFGLGRLSIIDENREPIIIKDNTENQGSGATIAVAPQTQTASVAKSFEVGNPPTATAGGKLVASRNGTKYYFPWCSSNIAEKNKIWFNSEAEARAKGLEPAANCKGLK